LPRQLRDKHEHIGIAGKELVNCGEALTRMKLRLGRCRYASLDARQRPLGQPATLCCATIHEAAHDAGEKGEQRHALGPPARAVEGAQQSLVQ
jgi:hypothetical protein